MRMTNKDLQVAYAYYNKKYFSNKLPHDMVVRFEKVWPLGVTSCYHDRPLFIHINDRLRFSKVLCDMTLIHEMVHVETPRPNNHGKWFHKRMLELARKGAFKQCW